MGGNADWRTVYHGIELCYDHERVWEVFPSVSLHGDSAPALIHLCRGAVPKHRKELSKVLCGGVSGGSGHRIGVHYLFRLCVLSAGSQPGCGGSHYGMGLYRGADFQHACACGSSQNGRPGCAGDDGAVDVRHKILNNVYNYVIIMYNIRKGLEKCQ